MTSQTVVGLGEVMLRLSPPHGYRLENMATLAVHAAGSEANVLAALARLGVPTMLVSVLPATPLGRRAAADLTAAGVDLSRVEWIAEGRMGTFFVEPGTGARSTSVLYDRAGSAFAEWIHWPEGALSTAAFALVSGITLALSGRARAAVDAMLAEAQRGDVPLCVDVNYRSRLWSPEAALAELEPLLESASVVVCSAQDAELVFDADPSDPASFRSRWAPRSRVCVITAGDHGSRAVGATNEVLTIQAVNSRMVDRLGLGDAFLAGLLDGLLRQCQLAEALGSGAALAALKATVLGDLSLARREDLEALEGTLTTSPVQR
jgi:2-dehydro-3-deoxygluconokinase